MTNLIARHRAITGGLLVLLAFAGVVIYGVVAGHGATQPTPSLEQRGNFSAAVRGPMDLCAGVDDDTCSNLEHTMIDQDVAAGMPICDMYGKRPTSEVLAYIQRTFTWTSRSPEDIQGAALSYLC